MVEVTVRLTEDNLQRLRERADASGQTMDELLNAILESDATWQQKLTEDPLYSLFGAIDSGDPTVGKRVDEIVYGNDR